MEVPPGRGVGSSAGRLIGTVGRSHPSRPDAGTFDPAADQAGEPRSRTAIMAPGWPVEYGLGIKRFRLPRLRNAGRRAPTLIGHTGASGSWLFWCPEHELYLAGTVDQTTAAGLPYQRLPRALHRLHTLPRAGDGR